MKKNFSTTDLVCAIWRMQDAGWTESRIIDALLPQLLKSRFCDNAYMGELKKTKKGSSERERMLMAKFHGIVGNWIMSTNRMPKIVREQFMLMIAKMDRTLHKDEKLDVEMNRYAVNRLSSARKKDRDAGNWDADTGGPEFHKMCVQIRDEQKK